MQFFTLHFAQRGLVTLPQELRKWPRSASRSPRCMRILRKISSGLWLTAAFYLLQTRPITSLFPVPADMAADPLRAMLSFGAVQGMLEPVTPLGRNLIEHIIAAGAQLFGMAVKAETQGALFQAGERLWINLTPLLRNTVGRRIVPAVMAFGLPGQWRGAGRRLARSSAATHAARDQPLCSATHRGAAVPLAGLVLLNLLYPDRRRRFIVERGEHLLRIAAQDCAAIRGSHTSGWPSWLISHPRSSSSTCHPRFVCSFPAWPAAWPRSTWSAS